MPETSLILSIIGLFLQAVTFTGLVLLWMVVRDQKSQFELLERRWRHDSRALHTGEDRISRRIDVAEHKLNALVEQVGQVELHTPTLGTYQFAQHLAGQGAPVDALVDRCGLSLGEAELITTIKQIQQKAQLSS